MHYRYHSDQEHLIERDEELIAQAQSGDQRAFGLLMQKYQFRVLKLVSRYISDPSEAMDIAQESFMKAYRALGKFRGESTFYTWLYRIAINTAKNHAACRMKRGMESPLEAADIESIIAKGGTKDYSAPERILLEDEIENVINEVIANLPKDLRMAITLREIEGKSYEEIAGIMSCPVGTVRSRIFRARDAIERRIKPLLED